MHFLGAFLKSSIKWYDIIRLLGVQLPRRNLVVMEYSLAFRQTDEVYFYLAASYNEERRRHGDTLSVLCLQISKNLCTFQYTINTQETFAAWV